MNEESNLSPEIRRLGSPRLAREQDVRTALAMLDTGPAGLVITGAPGTGKSAVARQVAARLRSDDWQVAAMVGRWSPRTLFRGVSEAFLGWGGELSQEDVRMMGAIGLAPSDDAMLETTCRLLGVSPLVLLFDDLDQNFDGAGFLDPGFGAVFERLCQAAGRGRVLVTTRTPLPPAAGDRLGVLRLGPPDRTTGNELAAGLPFLSAVDPATRDRVVHTTRAHPRSLRLLDTWLSANAQGAGPRLAAVTPGAEPIGLVMADLTGQQRETLLQAAICTVPVTVRDLAVACDTSRPSKRQRPEPGRSALRSVSADAARLAELGLLTAWEGWDGDTVYFADRWIAERLAPYQGAALADRHERAMNMHYSRTHGDGTFDDYVAVCRHLVAVQGLGDLTDFVLAVAESLEPDFEYAGMALLGEILPHVPAGYERLIRDRLVDMLIRHGFPGAAREVAERSLSAVEAWSVTHSQRDEARFCLGAARDTCGRARFADGRLPAAEAVLRQAVDVYQELAAEHPAFIEADQRLAGSLQHLGEVYRALGLPEHKDRHYETWAECSAIRTRLFQAEPSPETALAAGLAFQRLAELAGNDGDRDNALRLLGTRLAMLEAMAEMYPYDEDLAAELDTARQDVAADGPTQPLGTGTVAGPAEPLDAGAAGVAGILRQGPFAFNQWRADHADEELDLSGADLSGLDLDRMVFAGADLTGANLSRASARGAIFSGADLTDADLSGADLTSAGFGYSEMVNGDIAFTRLGSAMMRPATLTGAVLTRAILEHTSFRECDLTGVDLRGCDLSTLDLKRSGLDGAITGTA